MSSIQGNQGITGKVVGQNVTFGAGEFTDLMVTELQPRYYENVYKGNVFTATTQGAIAVTNLAAVATGFILSNPAGSGKNLVLLEVIVAQDLAAAAAIDVVSLAAVINPLATATVHTTPLTVNPALIGGAASSVGKADSSATLGATPVLVRTMFANSISATATTSTAPYVKDEIAGALCIAPGCAVALNAASATSFQTTVTWVEISV
jgi:hypothetical protein